MSNSYRPFNEYESYVDIHGVSLNIMDVRGPSAPFGNKSINYDFVLGFKCHCQDLIEIWIKRPRQYSWPGRKLIEQVWTLDTHVVPVANKGSKNPRTEWRICYTKAELLLLQSLNEVQTKLFVLLKLIAKSVLFPLCSEMTSYIMKNLVFWLVETNPPEVFLHSHLMDRLTGVLFFLKDCLSRNDLRSYMIEDRNLFDGRITVHEKDKLLTVVDTLINEKEHMLQRCDKLRLGLAKLKESPEMFMKEGEKRDKIEKLILTTNIVFKLLDDDQDRDEFRKQLDGNEFYIKCKVELYNLVIPDRDTIISLGGNAEEVYRHRLSSIVS